VKRTLVYTSQFKRDYKKRSRERGVDALLTRVIDSLIVGQPLPVQFRDHPLKGGYSGCRECHLKPDLLLIYVEKPDEIRLIRLGSHSELFD
jgi:mRNA interferase YafQ